MEAATATAFRASTATTAGACGKRHVKSLPLRSSSSSGDTSTSFWGTRLNVHHHHVGSDHAKAKARRGRATVSILTSPLHEEGTLTIPAPVFGREQADPKNVAAIILGGGAGTRLFPLTNTRAKPARTPSPISLILSEGMRELLGRTIELDVGFFEFTCRSLGGEIRRSCCR